MARSNTLQYMILGLLTRQPMTGYDIKQTFDQEKAEFWSAPFSQIYHELNRLLKSDLVQLVETDTASRKKTYRISAQGLTHFNEWLNEPLSTNATQLSNDDFVLRLHFLGKEDSDTLLPLFQLRRQTIKLEIAQLELELTEVVHHPEQYGHEFIIQKELASKKGDLKLLNSSLKEIKTFDLGDYPQK